MIILASASPRRSELLKQLNIDFAVRIQDCDEHSDAQNPSDFVMDIAKLKAHSALKNASSNDTIIAADTVVCFENEILGKPHSTQHAREMLKKLSGKTHTVRSGVCIIKNGVEDTFCNQTDVSFYNISDSEIDAYIASGEPLDKAGAYGIQGLGSVFVKEIHGDFYNVMGLPLAEVWHRLKRV